MNTKLPSIAIGSAGRTIFSSCPRTGSSRHIRVPVSSCPSESCARGQRFSSRKSGSRKKEEYQAKSHKTGLDRSTSGLQEGHDDFLLARLVETRQKPDNTRERFDETRAKSEGTTERPSLVRRIPVRTPHSTAGSAQDQDRRTQGLEDKRSPRQRESGESSYFKPSGPAAEERVRNGDYVPNWVREYVPNRVRVRTGPTASNDERSLPSNEASSSPRNSKATTEKSILGLRRPDDIKPTAPRQTPESTMTDTEIATFNRLFETVIRKTPNDERGVQNDDLNDFDNESDSGRPMKIKASKEDIQRFPPTLQKVARLALEESARKEQAMQSSSDPVLSKAIELAKPIMEKIMAAGTDLEIWQIVENELFSRFRELDMESPSPSTFKSKGSKERMSLSVFSLFYQRLLLVAQRTLCQRTTYSLFALGLLPAVKRLGPVSYAMGVSSGLFNELILYNWTIYHSAAPVLAVVEEMDRNMCTMNTATYDAVSNVTRHGGRAYHGEFGPANFELERVQDRFDAMTALREWKKRIEQGFVDAELEKVHRTTQEDALLKTGALFDSSAASSDALAER